MKKLLLSIALGALVAPGVILDARADHHEKHEKKDRGGSDAAGDDGADEDDADDDADLTDADPSHDDADNTDRNEQDRSGKTLTPFDQGGSERDRTITQQIRKAVVENDDLSTNAHNVKIITVDGVVTLRGPVKTAAEKATIAAAAKKTKGVKKVDDQLEVESKP